MRADPVTIRPDATPEGASVSSDRRAQGEGAPRRREHRHAPRPRSAPRRSSRGRDAPQQPRALRPGYTGSCRYKGSQGRRRDLTPGRGVPDLEGSRIVSPEQARAVRAEHQGLQVVAEPLDRPGLDAPAQRIGPPSNSPCTTIQPVPFTPVPSGSSSCCKTYCPNWLPTRRPVSLSNRKWIPPYMRLAAASAAA